MPDAPAPPDPAFTRALRRRDFRAALERLAREHGPALGRLCFALVGNQAEAEEMTQEILLVALRALPSFEERSSLRTWLFAIARRVCGKAVLKERRRAFLLATGPTLVPPATRDPLEETELRRRARDLRRALAELPIGQREVLLLRYAAGLCFREVAEICAITEEAARQRASTGLKRLRSALVGTPSAVEGDEPAAAVCEGMSR